MTYNFFVDLQAPQSPQKCWTLIQPGDPLHDDMTWVSYCDTSTVTENQLFIVQGQEDNIMYNN